MTRLPHGLGTPDIAVHSDTPERMALAFRFAMLAVVLHFLLSTNILFLAGIDYTVPGGNPLTKFHPATYVTIMAAIAAIRQRGNVRNGCLHLYQQAPGYLIFLSAMLLCAVLSAICNGASGTAIFVENFVPAGLLAYVLESSRARDRAALGRLVLALTIVNVLIGLAESLTQTHFIPVHLGVTEIQNIRGDFRPTAGFDHPLTGAFVVMLALIAIPEARLRAPLAVASFGILCVGLIEFGGRTALAVGIGATVLLAMAAVISGLAKRRLDPKLIGATVLAILLVPPAAYLLLTQTPIGERLLGHLYFDSSAEVRDLEWRVLNQISLRDIFFGMSEDRYPDLVFRTLGVPPPFADIENPWLLTFVKLGVFGFGIFALGLIAFLLDLWRASTARGRVILVCGLLVISASNSIGHKSDMLFFLTTFVTATAAFGLKTPLERRTASARSVVTGPAWQWSPRSDAHYSRGPAMNTATASPPRGAYARVMFASLRHDVFRMVLAGGLIAVLAVAAAVSIRPLYQANSSLLVTPSSEFTYRPVAGEDISATSALEFAQILPTEVEILQSPDLHREVIRSIGVGRLYPQLLQQNGWLNQAKAWMRQVMNAGGAMVGLPVSVPHQIDPVEQALILFDEHLSVQPSRTSTIINLSFTSANPQIAAEVLDKLEDGYFHRRSALYLNREAEFVSRDAAALKVQLDAVDTELARFKSDRQIGDFKARRNILLQQQGDLETQLRAAGAAVAQDTARVAQLNEQLETLPHEITQSRDANNDQRLAPLRANIESVRAHLETLLATYNDNSAPVIDVERQLSALEARLASRQDDQTPGDIHLAKNPIVLAVQGDLTKVSDDLQAGKALGTKLQSQLAAVTLELAFLNGSEQHLTELERTRSILDQNYRDAVKISEDRLVSESVEAEMRSSVRVLQAPVTPALPTRTRTLILEVGAMMALLGMAAIGLASHYFRRGYLTPEAFELETGLPVLISVSDGPRNARHLLDLRPI